MADRYWKVLDADGRSCHGGSLQWSPPRWDAGRGWVPGEWTPPITKLEPCVRGYHVCRDRDLLDWLGQRIYACEVRGRIIVGHNKVVAESVRLTCPTPWDECAARLFAVECAADALPIFERRSPNDSRVADALEVAFRYAVGDATDAELAAARDAAGAAARAAAGAAARAAAWAAARAAARAAAWDAAGAAAGAAAWAAAWDAAGAAAWDAARAAARAAAWDAARAAARAAAWDAAGAAARDAAGAAAWDAARDAAIAGQAERLLMWLGASTAETTGATGATE